MRAQPQAGADFLRVLGRDSGAWWRLVAAAVLGLVGLFVAATLAVAGTVAVARLLGFSDFAFDVTNGVSAAEIGALNVGLGALIGVAAGLVRLLYGVRPRWLSSTRPGLRWSWLGSCVGVSLAVWSLLLLLGIPTALMARTSPVDLAAAAFVVAVLVTTPLQAAGEEYLFRGLLLQALGATRMPLWLCCGINGALFAIAHLQFEGPLLADRFVLGCVLAWLAVRTAGLEAGIAIHAVKNVSVLLPAGLLGEVDAALDPSGSSWLPLVVDAVLLAVAVPWILRRMKRRQPAAPVPAVT